MVILYWNSLNSIIAFYVIAFCNDVECLCARRNSAFYEIYVHFLPESSGVLIAGGLGCHEQLLQFYRNSELIRRTDAAEDRHCWVYLETWWNSRRYCVVRPPSATRRCVPVLLTARSLKMSIKKNMSARRPLRYVAEYCNPCFGQLRSILVEL